MRMMHGAVALAAFVMAGVAGTGGAVGAESQYSSVALESCQQLPTDPANMLESGQWACTGYLGIPVLIRESDLRFFVTYGVNGANEPAAHETLAPFNYINDTLEWRLDDAGSPYATILRFFADSGDGGPETQVLVVTRIADDGVCHIAYVNASANPDANELARQAADLMATNFSCGFHQPIWIGVRGGL